MSAQRIIASIVVLIIACLLQVRGAVAEEIYGPVNLLKTTPTPFGAPEALPGSDDSTIRVTPVSQSLVARSLSARLLGARIYLPGRMVLGQPAEFIVKGRPGFWVAIAMADKNSGAKPVFGHDLHLGPDRQLVTLGQIPEGGVLSLSIETPIQGDLIGQCLYFETAVWSQPDFSDMELAQPVPSESSQITPNNNQHNGVLVAGEAEHKRGMKIVPDGSYSMPTIGPNSTMDSGRP